MNVQWKILTKMDGTGCKIHESINSLYLIKLFHLSLRWRRLFSSSLQIYRDISDRINCSQIDKYRTLQYSDRTSIPRFWSQIVAQGWRYQKISTTLRLSPKNVTLTSYIIPTDNYYGFNAHVSLNLILWKVLISAKIY
jgi:hypothetical protein